MTLLCTLEELLEVCPGLREHGSPELLTDAECEWSPTGHCVVVDGGLEQEGDLTVELVPCCYFCGRED